MKNLLINITIAVVSVVLVTVNSASIAHSIRVMMITDVSVISLVIR